MFVQLPKFQIPAFPKAAADGSSWWLCVWGKRLDWQKVIECNQVVPERARRFALGVKNLVRRLLRWDGRRKRGRRTYPINTPRLPIPVRSHVVSPGVLYLSLPLSTHPLLQYRINAAPFHLVTLGRRRLDRCNAEICKALQMRVSGVKISNAVGLLFCHSFQIN